MRSAPVFHNLHHGRMRVQALGVLLSGSSCSSGKQVAVTVWICFRRLSRAESEPACNILPAKTNIGCCGGGGMTVWKVVISPAFQMGCSEYGSPHPVPSTGRVLGCHHCGDSNECESPCGNMGSRVEKLHASQSRFQASMARNSDQPPPAPLRPEKRHLSG